MSAITTQGSSEPSLYSVSSIRKNTPTPAHCLSGTVSVTVGKTSAMSPVQFQSGESGLCLQQPLPETMAMCFELAHSFYNPEASLLLILS